MNYRQTLDYLYAQLPMFHRIGAAAYKADLGNTIAMCTLLGNPQDGFKSIHIAGTNGKGSTSHLIASVLQSAGYKTGLFTSPHLKDFRERIRINGKKIPKSYVSSFVTKNKKTFENIRPSFFEYTAVMAFQYFKDENVDIAVMETGMGGRLDSTNVVNPVACVITNISYDHMQYLGNTLEKIAVEKAGIIKKGVPVVIGETQSETESVFRHQASMLNSPILFADQQYSLLRPNELKGECIIASRGSISGERDEVPVRCPLKGIYQDKNIVTAYAALKIAGLNLKVDDADIQKGFAQVIKLTGLQGRWQVLGKNPKVICDVGHNEAGVGYIIEQLKTEDFKCLHWVLGIVNDKDADSVLRLLPVNAKYYFCKADIPRGLDASELKKQAEKHGLKGEVYPSVRSAFEMARNSAAIDDLVFVGGSTFIVAEIL